MAQTVSGARVPSRVSSLRVRARLVVLTLALLLAAFLGFKFWRVRLILGDVSSRLAPLSVSGPAGYDLINSSNLAAQLDGVADDFHNLRAELGPLVYLGPLASWVPKYGADLAQAPALLDYGEGLATGAASAAHLFNVITSEMDGGRASGQPLGQSALATMERHQVDIREAAVQLDQVLAARDNVHSTALSPRTRQLFDRVDRFLPLWSAGLNAVKLAPELLGGNGTRVYLLIVQNSDELRPTGGFISSVVRVRVDKGDISTLDFSDSYAIDNLNVSHPDAPTPLQRYMDAGIWVLRDANWSPDFPTSAGDIEQLYQLDRGVASDGVIAVNLKLVPGLLDAVGPVDVPSYTTVDPGNALAKLQEYWASPQGQGQTGEWWLHRKDFAGQLLVTVLERLRAGEFDRARLVRVLFDAFASKDVMLYLNDPTGEAQLQAADWAGQLSSGSGDRLMIVDSNVGFNKVDASVDRSADYSVELDRSGGARIKLTLSYTNRSPDTGSLCVHAPYYPPTYAQMQQGCYWDYLRLVAAPGAKLVSTTEGLEAGSDETISGRSVFHGYFLLPRGAKRSVEYDYQIPSAVADGKSYHLALENQPGATPRQIHVSIKLPGDWTDWTASPTPEKVDGGLLEYSLMLDHDIDVVVQKNESSQSVLAVGIGLVGLSLLSGGLWWLGRSKRQVRDSR